MVLEVEEFDSEVKNDLGGRLTSEAIIIAGFCRVGILRAKRAAFIALSRRERSERREAPPVAERPRIAGEAGVYASPI